VKKRSREKERYKKILEGAFSYPKFVA